MNRRSLLAAAPLMALLAACGTPPASPTPPMSSTPSPSRPAQNTTLAGEQVRLAELFRGTPVAFTMQQDGSLRATVPRRFSFDAGAIKVKPPLAAVLDRLAKAQSHTGARMRVSTPSDPEVRGLTLARDRALSVRDYLAGQGVVTTRLQVSGAVQTEQIEIVVSDAR
jgi:outer membrane protein OmpA-like peptidoglycan-associated protein